MARLGRDLASARWIHFKGWLFLLVAVLAGAGLWLDSPTVRTGALIGLCIWGACRFYYYAFYVIEKYTDPHYRFSGLLDFLIYLGRSRKRRNTRTL